MIAQFQTLSYLLFKTFKSMLKVPLSEACSAVIPAMVLKPALVDDFSQVFQSVNVRKMTT